MNETQQERPLPAAPENYFRTNNRQLAYALATAGCEFAPQPDGPSANVYSLGFLRANKIGVGKTIDSAAKEAVEKRIEGDVSYIFKRSNLLEACIKEWDKMVGEYMAAENQNRVPNFPFISAEAVMQVLYVHAQNCKEYRKLPWFNAAYVSTLSGCVTDEKIPGKPAPRRTVKGSGAIWQLGASEQFVKELLNGGKSK